MGVAFDMDPNLLLYPAITGVRLKISVNFGEDSMKFGPPHETFMMLMHALG